MKCSVTVVDPGKLAVRATIAEGDVTFVSVGMKGSISPTAFPGQKSEVTLHAIASTPFRAKMDRSSLDPMRVCRAKSL
jgi:multidrug resistance efflux pump